MRKIRRKTKNLIKQTQRDEKVPKKSISFQKKMMLLNRRLSANLIMILNIKKSYQNLKEKQSLSERKLMGN